VRKDFYHVLVLSTFYRDEFFQLIKETCTKYFNKPIDSVLRRLVPDGETKLEDRHLQALIFGSFMEPDANPRIYDEVQL
jgi:dynein heavy chain